MAATESWDPFACCRERGYPPRGVSTLADPHSTAREMLHLFALLLAPVIGHPRGGTNIMSQILEHALVLSLLRIKNAE